MKHGFPPIPLLLTGAHAGANLKAHYQQSAV
jgi:hypothetical protein